MRQPPYRYGRAVQRCTFRLSPHLIQALEREAKRRHVWVSALVEEILAAGVAVGAGGEPAPDEVVTGEALDGKHWCKFLIELPAWDALRLEADRLGFSVGQVIRNRLTQTMLPPARPAPTPVSAPIAPPAESVPHRPPVRSTGLPEPLPRPAAVADGMKPLNLLEF